MSQSRWTHNICEACWQRRSPQFDPIRFTLKAQEICCFCGKPTAAGIYIRFDPAETMCKGKHPMEEVP